MALDPKDQQLMENAFYNALKLWSKGGGGFGGGGSTGATAPTSSTPGSIGGKVLDKALTETGGLVKGFGGSVLALGGDLIKGGVSIGKASETIATELQKAGREGSTLAKVSGIVAGGFTEIAKYVEEGIDKFRDLSKSGAAFNNDVIEMRVSAANTRMTLGDFADVIKQNTQFMSTLGGSTTKGAARFTEFSKAFFDSGVSDNLRNMGYSTKELNELLVTQMATSKFRGTLDEASMKREIESVERLATEMDAVAKLTGKSRKEQEDLLRKQQEDGQVRAATELAVRKGGEGVRKAFSEMTVASQVGGKDFQKMQEQIFAMGRPSQEMAEKFAMAGGEAQKLMYAAAKAAKSGNEAEAKRLTEEAAIAYQRQQNSQTNLQLAAQGQKAAVEGVENSRILNDTLRKVAAEEKIDLNTKEGYNKAFRKAREQIETEQNEKKGVTDAMIKAESRAADATAALNNQLIKPLNEKIGPELIKFGDAISNANLGKGGARAALEKPVEEMYGKIAKNLEQKQAARAGKEDLESAAKTGLLAGDRKIGGSEKEKEFTKLVELIKKQGENPALIKKLDEVAAAQGKSKEDIVREASKGSATDIKNLLKQLEIKEEKGAGSAFKKYQEETKGEGKTFAGSVFDGVAKIAAGTLDITGQVLGLDKAIANALGIGVKRQKGSLGEAGKLIEDWGSGTLAMLHGKEGVITENQLMNMAKGLQSSSVENIIGELVKGVKGTGQTAATAGSEKPKLGADMIRSTAPMAKDASLNDVVKNLESLNMLMGQLLSQHEDLGSRQIRAVKATSSNLFERF